jgi:hypothetical protein
VDDSWFKSQEGKRIFMFSRMRRLTVGLTKPPVQWVPGSLSCGVRLTHSSLSSAEVETEWTYTASAPVCLYGMCTHKFIYKWHFGFDVYGIVTYAAQCIT